MSLAGNVCPHDYRSGIRGISVGTRTVVIDRPAFDQGGACQMEIGRVVGQLVATVKQVGLQNRTLLLVVPVDPDDVVEEERSTDLAYVAADYVGAGVGEVVLVSRGSAARVEEVTAEVPTDAAVVAIVDSVVIGNKTTFRKSG